MFSGLISLAFHFSLGKENLDMAMDPETHEHKYVGGDEEPVASPPLSDEYRFDYAEIELIIHDPAGLPGTPSEEPSKHPSFPKVFFNRLLKESFSNNIPVKKAKIEPEEEVIFHPELDTRQSSLSLMPCHKFLSSRNKRPRKTKTKFESARLTKLKFNNPYIEEARLHHLPKPEKPRITQKDFRRGKEKRAQKIPASLIAWKLGAHIARYLKDDENRELFVDEGHDRVTPSERIAKRKDENSFFVTGVDANSRQVKNETPVLTQEELFASPEYLANYRKLSPPSPKQKIGYRSGFKIIKQIKENAKSRIDSNAKDIKNFVEVDKQKREQRKQRAETNLQTLSKSAKRKNDLRSSPEPKVSQRVNTQPSDRYDSQERNLRTKNMRLPLQSNLAIRSHTEQSYDSRRSNNTSRSPGNYSTSRSHVNRTMDRDIPSLRQAGTTPKVSHHQKEYHFPASSRSPNKTNHLTDKRKLKSITEHSRENAGAAPYLSAQFKRRELSAKEPKTLVTTSQPNTHRNMAPTKPLEQSKATNFHRRGDKIRSATSR